MTEGEIHHIEAALADIHGDVKAIRKEFNGRLRILENWMNHTKGFVEGASAGSKGTLLLIAGLVTILGGGSVGSAVVLLVKVL